MSQPTKKKYAIIRCPHCRNLQLIRAPVKSHKCSYCDKVIKAISPEAKPIIFSSSPKEALRMIMKLKTSDRN